jgi:hypothetical protein
MKSKRYGLIITLFFLLSGCASLPPPAMEDTAEPEIPLSPTLTPTFPASGEICVSPDFKREIGRVTAILDCDKLEVTANGVDLTIELLGLSCPPSNDFASLESYLSQVFLGKEILIVYDEAWNEQNPGDNSAGTPGAYVFMNDALVNQWLLERLYFGSPDKGHYGCAEHFFNTYNASLINYFSTMSAPLVVMPSIPTFDINSVVECHDITLIGAGGAPYTVTDCNFK